MLLMDCMVSQWSLVRSRRRALEALDEVGLGLVELVLGVEDVAHVVDELQRRGGGRRHGRGG